MTRAFKPGKPTDLVLLSVIGARGQTMTYVARNWLRSSDLGYDVETPWVLRQLKRLERAGLVQRVRTSYVVQICWGLTQAGVDALNEGIGA